MDWKLRICYILEPMLVTVPFAVLRYLPFKNDLRISPKLFWSIYALLIAGRTAYVNLAAWPDMLSHTERQATYFQFFLLIDMLFYSAVRPFWKHLFVMGIIYVYGMAVAYPPFLVMDHIEDPAVAHITVVSFYLFEYFLTWKWMQKQLTDGMEPFYRYGTSEFWHTFWLFPFLFFAIEMVFALNTGGGRLNGYTLAAVLLGAIGFAAALRFVSRMIDCLQENRVLEGNLELAQKLYHVQLQHGQETLRAISALKVLRHNLRHWIIELTMQLEAGDFAAMEKSAERFRHALHATERR